MKLKQRIICLLTTISASLTFLSGYIKVISDEVYAVTSSVVYGDVNNDDVVDVFDLTLMKEAFIDSSISIDLTAADVSGDGIFDTRDIREVHNYLLGRNDGFTGAIRDKVESADCTIVTIDEPTETSLTAEMAEKADELGSAVAVYEYLYNNMRSEFYNGSRKGAIGAYEQGSGNDTDLSSLLIAMLRYLGYNAQYVTDIVGFTEEQLLSWTNSDSIEVAQEIYASQGREHTTYTYEGTTFYLCRYKYVQLTYNDQTYYLDICYKEYDNQDTVYDAIESGYTFENVDSVIENTDITALNNAIAGIQDSVSILENGNYALYGRHIRQRTFSSLPDSPDYLIGIEQILSDSITDDESDTVVFALGNSYQTDLYRSAELYNKSITVSYEVSFDSEELAEWLEADSSSIFTLPVEVMGQAFSVTPILKIDDETVLKGPSLNIGDTQSLYISTKTGSTTATYEEELTAGEMCSIIFDTGHISSNELLSSYQKALKNTETVNQKNGYTTDMSNSSLDESNVYNSDYLGSMLRFTGMTYFSQLDIATQTLAESNSIHYDNTLRFGIIGFKPEVNSNGIQKDGQYFVDILSNAIIPVSKKQNTTELLAFNFNRGLFSSELESTVLEEVLNVQALSTSSIFRYAQETNIPIITLSESSEYTTADLDVDSADSKRIQAELDAGKIVITTQSEVSCGKWNGIGYIVMSADGSTQEYIISGGYNGGITFDPIGLFYTINVALDLALIAESIVTIATMLTTISTLTIAPVALLVISIASIGSLAADIFEQSLLYYDYMFNDDIEAGIEIWASTLSNSAITLVTMGLAKGIGSVSSHFTKSRLASTYGASVIDDIIDSGFDIAQINSKVKAFKSLGMTQNTIQTLLSDAKCMFLGDDILNVIAGSGGNSNLLARLVLHNGDDFTRAVLNTGVLDDFCNLAWKYGDNVAKVLVCGDDAISFVVSYSDDAADVIKCFQTGNVTGTSKLLDSLKLNENKSTVFTFATDKLGKTFAAGSGNYQYNPTITVPEGYFDDIAEYTGSNYYYEKYNKLLTKDFVNSMEGIDDSVKAELNRLIDAIEYTKKQANNASRFYTYGNIKEPSFTENHSVTNCGEVWSAREAILNGATFEELTYQSIYSSSGMALDMCDNCIHTFIEYLKVLEMIM